MPRHPLEIRDARPEDAAALQALWADAGSGVGESPALRPLPEAAAALAQVAADPDERIIVGFHEGALVAAICLRCGSLTPLHAETAVHTSYLLVSPAHRRHGFARALLDVAVSWAEEKNVASVTAITASNSRDTNRFLARLGLGTVATVRVASTGVLRRKLTPEPLRRDDARRHLGRILVQRRSLQRRGQPRDDAAPASTEHES